MYFIYILESIKCKRRYIGCTKNIDRRLYQHNQGLNLSTKPYRPYKIIYIEEVENKEKAYIREKQLKRYKGGKALKKLISCWDGGAVKHNSL